MTKLLISPLLMLGCLLAPAAFAQEVSPSFVAVSATASAFQVIDDARAKTGDADLLYIQAAVARNEAAIEAAKTILKTSFDADIRMMAGDSLKAHDSELRTLQAWLNLHGPKEMASPVVAPPAPLSFKPLEVKPVTPKVVETKPAVTKPAVVAVAKPAVAVTPVSASLPVSPPSLPAEPQPASTEVTITTPHITSSTEPLPGANLSMNPVHEPTMQLLDIPPVPVSLTPVTR